MIRVKLMKRKKCKRINTQLSSHTSCEIQQYKNNFILHSQTKKQTKNYQC